MENKNKLTAPKTATLLVCLSFNIETNQILTRVIIFQVIQKRFDGSVNFERSFEEFENGFGVISGEYWLGELTVVNN